MEKCQPQPVARRRLKRGASDEVRRALFWSKTEKSGNCVLWTGSVVGKGYGRFFAGGGRTTRAHRWIFEQMRGPVPLGMVVMHVCDNRLCVNVDHLRLGSQSENVRDSVAKGRWIQAGGRPRVALDDDQKREALQMFRAGVSKRRIAAHFRAPESSMSTLIKRMVR